MKKISKLALNKLSKKELPYSEMNKVKGGINSCLCGCCYGGDPGDIGHGGSSDDANGYANCMIPTNSPYFCDGNLTYCNFA